MKYFALLSTLAVLAFANPEINNDFISGFEQGITLTDDANIKEFGCPPVKVSGPLSGLNQFIGPLKMMSGLTKDKNLETLVSTVEVFVGSSSSLMAVFNNYEGDQFCSGLIFGQKGSHMLIQIAKTLVVLKQQNSSQNSITKAKGRNGK